MKNIFLKSLLSVILVILIVGGAVPMILAAVDNARAQTESGAESYLEGEGYYVFAEQVDEDLLPASDNTHDLGSDDYSWNDAYIDGQLYAKTGRTATYVVAANNSSTHVIAQADYICDGTADDVQIQAAIDALPSGGGKVYLAEGQFNISSAIQIRGYLHIQGASLQSTILQMTAHVNCLEWTGTGDQYFFTLTDIKVNGGNYTGDGLCINPASDQFADVYITRVFFENFNGCGVNSTQVWGYRLTDMLSEHNTGDGIKTSSGGSSMFLKGVKTNANGGMGASLQGNAISVIGCEFRSNDLQGLRVQGDEFIIIGNNFYNNGQDAVDTYAQLHIYGGSSDTTVIGNFLDGNNQAKYGILINNAGSTGTRIIGNQLENHATSNVYDAGTTVYGRNIGHITENSGTATINSGQTVAEVTHGLSVTPDEEKISLVALEIPTNAPIQLTVAANATSTKFWIVADSDPGASNQDVGWSYAN